MSRKVVPIAFASHTLNVVVKRYSQLDREALVLVFGVKHFHQYNFGEEVLHCVRSQTPTVPPERKPSGSSNGICKIATLGTN